MEWIGNRYLNKDTEPSPVFDTYGRLRSIVNNQQTPSSISITYTTDGGKLIQQITDGAGRKYNFTYSNGLLTRISYTGQDNAEDDYVNFAYDNTKLSSVIKKVNDSDVTVSEYTYSGFLLSGAEDIDGYTLAYTYNTAASWQPYRVLSVAERDAVNDVDGGTLTFAYGHNQTTITDHKGTRGRFCCPLEKSEIVTIKGSQPRPQLGCLFAPRATSMTTRPVFITYKAATTTRQWADSSTQTHSPPPAKDLLETTCLLIVTTIQ